MKNEKKYFQITVFIPWAISILFINVKLHSIVF